METKKTNVQNNVRTVVNYALGYPVIFVEMPELGPDFCTKFKEEVAVWVAEQIQGMTGWNLPDLNKNQWDRTHLLFNVCRVTERAMPLPGMRESSQVRFKELCKEFQQVNDYLNDGFFPVPGYTFYPTDGLGPHALNCINATMGMLLGNDEKFMTWDARCKAAHETFVQKKGENLPKYGCVIRDTNLGYPIYFVTLDPNEFDVPLFFDYHEPKTPMIDVANEQVKEARYILDEMRKKNMFPLNSKAVNRETGPRYLVDFLQAFNFVIASRSGYFSSTYGRGMDQLQEHLRKNADWRGDEPLPKPEEKQGEPELGVKVHVYVVNTGLFNPHISYFMPCEHMDKVYDPGYKAPMRNWDPDRLSRFMDVLHATEKMYHNNGEYNKAVISEMTAAVKMLVEKHAILINPEHVDITEYRKTVLPLLTPRDHRLAEFLMSNPDVLRNRTHGTEDIQFTAVLDDEMLVGTKVRLDMVWMSQNKNRLPSIAQYVSDNIQYAPEIFIIQDMRPGADGTMAHPEYRLNRFLYETWMPADSLVKIRR